MNFCEGASKRQSQSLPFVTMTQKCWTLVSTRLGTPKNLQTLCDNLVDDFRASSTNNTESGVGLERVWNFWSKSCRNNAFSYVIVYMYYFNPLPNNISFKTKCSIISYMLFKLIHKTSYLSKIVSNDM